MCSGDSPKIEMAQKILNAQRVSGSTEGPVGKPRGFPESADAGDSLGEHEQVFISVQRLCAVLLKINKTRSS